jgi:NAD-dependent dihydropyrimidine dehydrogenase PreA subunit
MTIERIDIELCNGCGICVESCPMDVIRIDEKTGKAVVTYPEDCTLCNWCELDCPQTAICISPKKGSQVLTSWG